MTNLLWGICAGVIMAAMFVEFYILPKYKNAPAKVVYECSESQRHDAAVEKLALLLDGDMLIASYTPPKPAHKPQGGM